MTTVNVDNTPSFKMTGWYSAGSVWESWVGPSTSAPNPTGHAVTLVMNVQLLPTQG
jgi:hypothetical protein